MILDTEFGWKQAQEIIDNLIFQHTKKHLSDLEVIILQGAWNNQTYEEIAEDRGYTSNYLSKDVGNKLWTNLSAALEEKVSKKNFRSAIQRQQQKKTNPKQTVESIALKRIPTNNFVFPEGAIALDSPFYIERPQVETVCYQTVAKPGSLIRIKAAKWMGKTSLIYRILAGRSPYRDNLQKQIPKTVYLDFGSVERSILGHLDKLLRWICAMVSRQLSLENKVKDYWDTDILGSNDNCTVYFEEYLLQETEGEIILALDNIDRLFSYEEVIEDFFGMLRSWHEKGKIDPGWAKIKLILAHSTEVYIPLDINQSPFNTGVPISLEEFTPDKIGILANLHQLNCDGDWVMQLMDAIGGHPYLVRLAMYQIKTQDITLKQFLSESLLATGIYSNPLRRLQNILKKSTELTLAYSKVVNSEEPIALDSVVIYQLHSIGLVKYQQNLVVPSCKLYRDYFKRVLNNLG